jgi:hypothetical protein
MTSRAPAAVVILLSLFTASLASAADDGTNIHWKKIKLSDQFMNEGATFGDFNHDGKTDLISGPYWYEGPDFSPEKRHEIMPVQTYKTDNDYSKNFFAFAYDFNGDGWDDVLIIGFPGDDASWFENPRGKEAGHWTRHKVFDHVDDESPTFADFLKTGKPVLLCATGGRMGYATPDWSDTTKPWTFHPISGDEGFQRFTHGLGWGDVNGDGRNDFLIAKGWYEQPASLDGDPVWKFHPANFGPGGAQMYVHDVNNDGRPDVISSLNAHGYGLAWFEQMSDGNFHRHLILSDQPQQKSPQGVQFSELHAVDLIDINGDGLPGIVTGKRYFAHGSHGPDALGPAVLYWFELKRGDDSQHVQWISHEIDNDSGVGTQVVAKRIDGGKIPSIVVGNKKGTFVFIPDAK